MLKIVNMYSTYVLFEAFLYPTLPKFLLTPVKEVQCFLRIDINGTPEDNGQLPLPILINPYSFNTLIWSSLITDLPQSMH